MENPINEYRIRGAKLGVIEIFAILVKEGYDPGKVMFATISAAIEEAESYGVDPAAVIEGLGLRVDAAAAGLSGAKH